MKNPILLNFDVEEFDLPLEYGEFISEEEQFEFSLEGLKKILNLLDKYNIKATFFITASFAEHNKPLIKQISNKHEIASHGLKHKNYIYDELEIKESKKIIESIIKKNIFGLRFPRLKKVDFSSLFRLGFKYDSSISPAYMPRRYNYYSEKRKINLKEGIYEVPTSTFPIFRLPFSWLFSRLFGFIYLKLGTLLCLKNPGFVNLYFHSWEFNNLNNFKIPFYIKKNSGWKLHRMLEKYILWCKNRNFSFSTIYDFLSSQRN